MRLSALLIIPLLSLLPLLSATTPPPPLFTATVFHFPPSTSTTPLPLATLAYHPLHPELSTILSFTPPPCSNSSSKALARIGIILPPSSSDVATEPRYRISLTSLASLHAPFQGRFSLAVGRDGEALGASWHAGLVVGGSEEGVKKKQKKKKNGLEDRNGEFELLVAKEGPNVMLDRSVGKTGRGAGVGTKDEEGEEVVEKTLFQR